MAVRAKQKGSNMIYIGIKRAASDDIASQREAATAVLRKLISDCSPEYLEYTLSHDEAGRPYISDAKNTDISVSHSGTYAACALIAGKTKRVGIDIEKVKESKTKVAKRFFTPEENERISSLGEAEAAREFAKIWTRYEAKSKYLGRGLADIRKKADVYFDSFFFEGDDGCEYALSVCSKEKEETGVAFM